MIRNRPRETPSTPACILILTLVVSTYLMIWKHAARNPEGIMDWIDFSITIAPVELIGLCGSIAGIMTNINSKRRMKNEHQNDSSDGT